MNIHLIDIESSGRSIWADCAQICFGDVEITENVYNTELFAELKAAPPQLVVFDLSGREDCALVCGDAFAQLPHSCFLLIGDADGRHDELFDVEPALFTPFCGYLKKPLRPDSILQALQSLRFDKPKNIHLVGNSDVVTQADLMRIFEHHLLLTHLFKGNCTSAEMRRIRSLLDLHPAEQQHYFRAFVIRSKNEENDPLPNNFALFSFLHQHIRCQNIVACSEPLQLTGIVCGQTKTLLPLGGIEWTTLNRWLQDPLLLPQPLFVSLSPVFDELDDAPGAYQCATTGLQKSFFSGYRHAAENDTPLTEKLPIDDAKQLTDEFDLLLFSKDKWKMLAFTDSIYDRTKSLSIHYLFGIRRLYMRLFYRLFVAEARLRNTPVQKDLLSEKAHSIVENTHTFKELHRYLLGKINSIFDDAITIATSTQSNTMHILEYIHKTYNNPALTLQVISENVFLSPSHLSAEFKKTMGMPVAKYLNSYRIQQSKYLLDNPANKLKWVAQIVGYSDARQFSKAFKRIEGMSPTEYRRLKKSVSVKTG